MQCPNHDGILAAHARKLDNNLTISYSTCPVCRGYWMESFAANFITIPPEELTTTSINQPSKTSVGEPLCPVCQKPLIRETGENIPDTVVIYRCVDNHGYFFPTAQLAAFKKAQTAKINYFKVWNIPLPGVASVLLAGLLVLVVAGGGYFALTNIQNRQVTTSQASQVLTGRREVIDAETRSALIIATTSTDATVTLHIPAMGNLQAVMPSSDRRTHAYQLNDVSAGAHTYYFSIQVGDTTTMSDIFDFTMPAP